MNGTGGGRFNSLGLTRTCADRTNVVVQIYAHIY